MVIYTYTCKTQGTIAFLDFLKLIIEIWEKTWVITQIQNKN